MLRELQAAVANFPGIQEHRVFRGICVVGLPAPGLLEARLFIETSRGRIRFTHLQKHRRCCLFLGRAQPRIANSEAAVPAPFRRPDGATTIFSSSHSGATCRTTRNPTRAGIESSLRWESGLVSAASTSRSGASRATKHLPILLFRPMGSSWTGSLKIHHETDIVGSGRANRHGFEFMRARG